MKRKLILLLTLCCVLCCISTGLIACQEQHTHVYNQRVVSETYLASSATCLQKAKYYFSCECGDVGSVTFEHDNYAPHVFENYTANNDAKCGVNGTETAACEQNGCNKTDTREIVGSALEHSFTNYVFDDNADCGKDGTETAICDRENCNVEHTRTKVGSALEHEWSAWSSNGNNTHTRTCLHNSAHTETKDCNGGTATCTQKATCKDCNEKYGKLEEHTYSNEYGYTGTHHWLDATCGCDLQKDYAEHILGDDGYCSVCAAPVTDTAGILYDTSTDGTYAKVIGYEGTATKVRIADTYNSLPVKSIYDRAFEYTSITSIIIPDSVTSLGEGAFYHCESLTSIEISNSITAIGWGTFDSCYRLTSVKIGESVTSIGDQAFAGCSSLTSITIPDSVTSIGRSAFYMCSSLMSVTIGDSVTSIDKYAFEGCKYNVSENMNYIGDKNNPYAILVSVANKNYSTYMINENTKHICRGAFQDCSHLSTITIHDNVISIGGNLFEDCGSLEKIYCRAESQPSGWDSDWKGDCSAQVVWGYDGE